MYNYIICISLPISSRICVASTRVGCRMTGASTRVGCQDGGGGDRGVSNESYQGDL